MATIETKYSVGDVVFHAGTTTERKQHPCPDCHDTRKWTATSPAGNEYTFPCPRCAASYSSFNDLSLSYTATVPHVVSRTIGSIQYNSHGSSWDHGARYMATETGVGGGSVYSEADLYATHDEAMAAATVKAAEANATHKPIVDQFNRTLEISDYQLENARMKRASERASEAGQLLWNVNELFDTISEADTKDAIIEAVDDYRSYSRDRDIEKLYALVDAARQQESTSC